MPAVVHEVVMLLSKINREYTVPKMFKVENEANRKDVVRQFCTEQLNLRDPVFFSPTYKPVSGATSNNCHVNVLREGLSLSGNKSEPQHCWMISVSPDFDRLRTTDQVSATFHSVLRKLDGTFREATPLRWPADYYILEERFIHEKTVKDLQRREDAWMKDRSVDVAYKNYGEVCAAGPCIFAVQGVEL